MRKTKLLVSGGGSLIQDVTSSKSLYYYLTIMGMAKMCGAKVMLYANGIGPIVKKKNLKYVKAILGKADLITLRDKSSRDELEGLLNKNVPVFVTADPVFALKNGDSAAVSEAVLKSGVTDGKDFFVLAIREWKNSDKALEDKIAAFAKYVKEKYEILPLVIPMQDIYDKEISKRVAEKISPDCALMTKPLSPEVMLGVVGRARFVVGMRLHTLIYAVKNHVPVIALDYDPKVSAVMESMQQGFSQKVEEINFEALCKFTDELIKNQDEICDGLKEKSMQYEILANKNVEMAIELICQ